MNEWLDFQGEATDRGGVFVLTPTSKNGSVELDMAYVQVGATVKVRKGAIGRVVSTPTGSQPTDRPPSIRSSCPHGTMCIGLVELCCGSGEVVGACLGAWGC